MTESINLKQNSITVIGVYGGYYENKLPVSFLLGKTIAIDAGSLMRLGAEGAKIEHVFLTHAHFDHIASLPYLLDTFFERDRSLKLYGLEGVLANIKLHLFNDQIWPDFSRISNEKISSVLEYHHISLEKKVLVNGYSIEPLKTNHTVESCGYVVERDSAILISGDTFYCDEIIEAVNKKSNITTLFLECSYPSRLFELAKTTMHLTPQLIMNMVKKFKRPVDTYIYHIKPQYEEEVKAELKANGLAVLQAGNEIMF